jgi:hypothetical protein
MIAPAAPNAAVLQSPPREPVGAFGLGMAGVAVHPVPSDLVPQRCRLQPLPQMDVLDRILGRVF